MRVVILLLEGKKVVDRRAESRPIPMPRPIPFIPMPCVWTAATARVIPAIPRNPTQYGSRIPPPETSGS